MDREENNDFFEKLVTLRDRFEKGGIDDQPFSGDAPPPEAQISEEEARALLKLKPEEATTKEAPIGDVQEDREALKALHQEEIRDSILAWRDNFENMNVQAQEESLRDLRKMGDHQTIAREILMQVIKNNHNEALQELHRRFDDPDMY